METLGADIDSLVSSRKIGGNHDVRRYGFTPASGFWGLLTINRNGAHDQPERCSRWPGIGAHDRPELVLTMRRNTQDIAISTLSIDQNVQNTRAEARLPPQ